MKNTSLQITIILFLVLSQMLLLSHESVGQSKELKKKLKEANKALNIGNNSKAKRLFEEAYKSDSTNIECLNGLMTVYYNDTDIENLCRILKIIIPELDSKIKSLEKDKPSKKEKNKIDKYYSYLDDANNYQFYHQDDCNTDATVEENSIKDDSEKETNRSAADEKAPPIVIQDLDTSQTQKLDSDVNNNENDDSESKEIDSVSSLNKQIINQSTDIDLTLDFFDTNVSKVKEQFMNEIKGLSEKNIDSYSYELNELRSYNNKLNDKISNIKKDENLIIKELEEEILTTSAAINKTQRRIREIDLEIDYFNNKKIFYEQFNSSINKRETENNNNKDSIYEAPVKYYTNTLLVIQENNRTEDGSQVNKTINALDKIFEKHDNLNSIDVISFEGRFERNIKLYTIIKNYQTKNEIKANSVSKFKGKVFKFLPNDKLICLNDNTEYNLAQSKMFNFPKSIIEIINELDFSSDAKLISIKRPNNDFYKKEENRLSKLKIIDVNINQSKINDLEKQKNQLVDSVALFQNKLDEYEKLMNENKVLVPILIMDSNIKDIDKFFLESADDMWNILKKQISNYALKEKIVTVSTEDIDGVKFYWNELIEKNRKPRIYGYKLLKWGYVKNENEYFLNYLFEIRFNEISTTIVVEGASSISKGKKNDKEIIKSPVTTNSPSAYSTNTETFDGDELKIEKEDDVNILIYNTSRWKYINGTTNFSDFLSIRQNENLMGWILPDEEGLRNVLNALYNGDGGDLISQLSISNTSTLFLTKEKRIDSRTQEFMVKVLSVESNGTIKTKEVVEGEDVNILLNSKYEY